MRRVVHRILIIVLLSSAIGFVSKLRAQEVISAKVTLESVPSGASVSLQGRLLGATPIVVSLPRGTYTLDFELSGYPPRSERIAVIDPNIKSFLYADMTLPPWDPQLTRVLASVSQVTWDVQDNARLAIFQGAGLPLLSTTYRAIDGKVGELVGDFGIIDDATLRQHLKTLSPIYQSPSNDWLLYTSNLTRSIVLFNPLTNETINTQVALIPEQVEWSRDSTRGWIVTDNGRYGAFFYISNGKVEAFGVQSTAQTASSIELRHDRVLSYPTSTYKVLLAMTDERLIATVPYLYDLKTQIATPLSAEDVDLDVYDAGFSTNEQWIYVVYEDRMVRYSADLSERQLLNTLPKLLEIGGAVFSPTTDYVFLGQSTTGSKGNWLYKIPK